MYNLDMVSKDVISYNDSMTGEDQAICKKLCGEIVKNLNGATNKVWHGAPVWFIEENPIAGYSVQKNGVQLLFWSGQSFDEPGLSPEGKFKAAEARYTSEDQISTEDLARWLEKSQKIQWDYKNIVKRKGELEKL